MLSSIFLALALTASCDDFHKTNFTQDEMRKIIIDCEKNDKPYPAGWTVLVPPEGHGRKPSEPPMTPKEFVAYLEKGGLATVYTSGGFSVSPDGSTVTISDPTKCSGGTCTAPTGIKVDINANVKVKVEKSKPKKTCGLVCKVGRAVFGKRCK